MSGVVIDDTTARRALESIRLDWADTPDDVWGAGSSYHVGGLHDQVFADIMRSFSDARRSAARSPIGVVVRGPAGSGKTHLLGQVREQVQQSGGYFFLVKLLDGSEFWKSVTVAIVEDLARPTPTHASQLIQVLDNLAVDAGVEGSVRAAVTGQADLTPELLDTFVTAVYSRHPQHRRRSQNILRGLVLTTSDDNAVCDLGESFLYLDIDDARELSRWGIRRASLGYQEMVQNISRIVALDGPALLAVDQIDTLIEAGKSVMIGGESLVEKVAHGLMSLRDNMSRTSIVISSITAAWEYLADHVMRSVVDRFRLPPQLQRPPTAEFGRHLLAKRFAPGFGEIGFTPPYPTWPVADAALTDANLYTPRQLMITVDRHIGRILRQGDFAEITSLTEEAAAPRNDGPGGGGHDPSGDPPTPSDDDTTDDPELAALDQRYAELIAGADPLRAVTHSTEDKVVPGLLHAGLATWIEARPGDSADWHQAEDPGPRPAVHARISHVIDAHRDIVESWSFRAVAHHNAIAVQNRLTSATTAAGLSLGSVRRTLVVLRREPWPNGPKTARMVEELQSRGGMVIAWTESDIRRLMALRQLRSERPPRLRDWIDTRNPAGDIAFLSEVLGAATAPRPADPAPLSPTPAPGPPAPAPVSPVPVSPPPAPGPTVPENRPTPPAPRPVAPPDNAIQLGTALKDGSPVSIPLVALRKHAFLAAGSGSGKTVLIRHIVESAALQGVSSIVIDINNDLSRLGTPWPAGSRSWSDAEHGRADTYFANTEVIVWTPGRNAGRPLSFQPLPDFAAIADDGDEFHEAVAAAVGSLGPRIGIVGHGAKIPHLEAVLRQAMSAFGRRGGGDLAALAALLEDLPDGVSPLNAAPKLALQLSENLKAAMANDPMLGGRGTPADPGVLLTPSPGYRARISVINLAGLTTGEDGAAGFVNQLEMALFSWIKKHPATGPLGGLLVLDEAQNFAPSTGGTSSLQSTIALASQARKYGLGLLVATQSPTGVHNRLSGNAATQVFGLLNSPSQVANAKEIAARKNSPIGDVGRLPAGTFYVAADGGRFIKTATPLCVSYHPQSPPTEDEVLEIARGSQT
ncbi:MAG: DUF853 family protein [Gordonia sp. (in: high G+C Gram-positive bacteria)]